MKELLEPLEYATKNGVGCAIFADSDGEKIVAAERQTALEPAGRLDTELTTAHLAILWSASTRAAQNCNLGDLLELIVVTDSAQNCIFPVESERFVVLVSPCSEAASLAPSIVAHDRTLGKTRQLGLRAARILTSEIAK